MIGGAGAMRAVEALEGIGVMTGRDMAAPARPDLAQRPAANCPTKALAEVSSTATSKTRMIPDEAAMVVEL